MSSPSTPPPTPVVDDEAPDPDADRMLAAARRGSNRAWAALVDRLDPACRDFAHLVLGGHGVDSALLAAYVRAYRARRTAEPPATVFLLHHTWIACGHEIRRHQRRRNPAPGRRPIRDDRTPRLGDDPRGRSLALLRPEERAVWALVERAGLPVATVAAALGVEERVVATVATRVVEHVDTGPPPSPYDGLPTDPRERAVEVEPEPGPEPRPDEEPEAEPEPDEAAVADPDATAVHDTLGDEFGAEEIDPGSLDPEPASPAFWRELGRRLRAESEATPAAPRPKLPEPGDPSPSLTPAKAPPVAMQRRAPRRARRRKPDEIDQLVDEAGRQRPRRRWGAWAIRTLAVVIVAAVFGVAVVGLYRVASNSREPVRGETVADVVRRSMLVLDDAGTWSASVEVTSLGERHPMTVVAANDGSYRVQDSGLGRLTTYDARFAVVMDSVTGLPPRHDTGVAPGAPDVTAPRHGYPQEDLAIAARTLSVVDDERPATDRLNGRDVLTMTAPLTGDIDLTYVVDASSLAPVRITWSVEGATVRELRFADVELGAAAPDYTQDLGDVAATDQGFAQVRLTEIATRTQMQPVTPDYLPDGFTFTGAAVDEAGRVSSIRYARGPQELIVTLRPSPVEAGAVWDDPFDRGDDEATPSELEIDSGPFRGVTALQVSGGRALPSVWGADGEIAFTVAGDLNPDELARVARSLRRS